MQRGHSSLIMTSSLQRLRLHSAPEEKRGNVHVQVLLGMLDVPLNLPVYVEVKLLGHRQGDQRCSLWVWFLTAVKTAQHLYPRSITVHSVHAGR